MTTRYPRTLPGLFDRALRKYADRPAIRDESRSLSYRDLDERSARLADGLCGLSVGTGDRVGALLGNAAASPVVDIGILRAGGARLPLNPQHSTDELQYLLDDAGAATVICDAAQFDAVAAVSRAVESLRTVIVVGADDAASADEDTALAQAGADSADGVDVHRYEDLLASHDGDGDRPTPDPDDVAGHYYTGGTTGRPKGVCYSHRGLVENVGAHLLEFGFDGDDVGLLTTPLSHSAGTFCWAALLGGGTVLLRDGFDPGDAVATIERADVTWTFLVPTMLYRLLDDDSLATADLSSLDRVVYGAAPMRTDRLEAAIERFGPVFHQFYGQTEVPNLITTFPPREHARAAEAGDTERLRSAGTSCLRATVEVRDAETDEPLPPGEVGEVVVAAPYAFEEYYERPDATAESLREGWVYTGDIGTMDEAGYLTLLDRSSDVIVTGGMNVYSRTVERVLREHPEVADAAVDDGLDVDALSAETGPLTDRDAAVDADEISNDALLELDVDVLVPAAVGGVLTAENAPNVQASLVVEGANEPTTAEADAILAERDVPVIPDILANAGGVTASYFEWLQNTNGRSWTHEEVREELDDRMLAAWEAVRESHEERGVPWRDAAYAVALERVAESHETLGIWP